MIVAAAVCPHPPLLFRELTGQQDVVAELRAACREAVGLLVDSGAEAIVAVGGDTDTARWESAPAPVTRFGGRGPALPGPSVPLSLGVATRLLQEASCRLPVRLQAVAENADVAEVGSVAAGLRDDGRRLGLLVMGDGTATRGERGPGYIDPRAFQMDEQVVLALKNGDCDALLAVDPVLAAELMMAGRAAFQVLASAVRREGGTPNPRLLYRDDPFGVLYVVASWTLEAG